MKKQSRLCLCAALVLLFTLSFARVSASPLEKENRRAVSEHRMRLSRELIAAVNQQNKDLVSDLIRRGADVNAAKDAAGNTALMLAGRGCWKKSWTAKGGYWKANPKIVKILINAGAELDVTNREGNTALILASGCGHREIVQMLLDAGADVYGGSNPANTALVAAYKYGHEDIVALLQRHCWRKR